MFVQNAENVWNGLEGVVGGTIKKGVAVALTDQLLGGWVVKGNSELMRRLRLGFSLYCANEAVEDITTGTSNFRTIASNPVLGVATALDDSLFYAGTTWLYDNTGASGFVAGKAVEMGVNPSVAGYGTLAVGLETSKMIEGSLANNELFSKARNVFKSFL